MYGFGVKIRSVDACVPFFDKRKRQRKGMCAEMVDEFWDSVEQFDVVIIAMHWGVFGGAYKDYAENDLPLSLEALRGKKVVLMAHVPELHQYQYNKYALNLMEGRMEQDKKIISDIGAAWNSKMREMAKGKAIWFNPLDDLDESTKATYPFYDGLVMYKDSEHLNEFGIRQITKEVLPKQKEFWEGLLR